MREAILLLLSFSRIFHLLLSYYKKTRVFKRFAPNYNDPYKFRYAKLFEIIYTQVYITPNPKSPKYLLDIFQEL